LIIKLRKREMGSLSFLPPTDAPGRKKKRSSRQRRDDDKDLGGVAEP
jgi:hypothetical protein